MTAALRRQQRRDQSALSYCLPHGSRDRLSLHVADFHPCANHALTAILEGNFGRDISFPRAVIEGLDQRRIAISDKTAPHFLRARKFSVVRIELLVQDEETLDLSSRHHLVG